MSLTTGQRIHGPYPHRSGWKVVIHDCRTGERTTRQLPTQAEAERLVTELREQAQARTVGVTLLLYLEHLRERNRPRSVDTTELRLGGLLDPVMESPLSALSPARAQELYVRYAQGRAPATHHNTLGQARTFRRWAIKQGFARTNPWEHVEPIGEPSAGKDQLRVDEARKLYRAALDRVQDDRACAALVALLLGLRASELVSLVPRDVDAGATLLWVPGTKTHAAKRRLEIPGELREPLVARCGRERLFPYRRWWVREAARWACRVAGVPEVCAHGLRGLHATLRVELGDLARAMGHSGTAVTERHYVAPGAIERATARRVGMLLGQATEDGSVSAMRVSHDSSDSFPASSPRTIETEETAKAVEQVSVLS